MTPGEKVIACFRQWFLIGPHERSFLLPQFGSIVELRPVRQRAAIGGLWVSDSLRGRGYGTETLRWLLIAADICGSELELYVLPYGSGRRLRKAELQAWYERYGFMRTNNYGKTEYIRPPFIWEHYTDEQRHFWSAAAESLGFRLQHAVELFGVHAGRKTHVRRPTSGAAKAAPRLARDRTTQAAGRTRNLAGRERIGTRGSSELQPLV